MFALLALTGELGPRIVLKGEPGLIEVHRERFASVSTPSYLNHRHWNLVLLDGGVPTDEIEEWVEDSYALVIKKLPKRLRPNVDPGGVTDAEG